MPTLIPIFGIVVFVLLNILIALIVLKSCVYVIPPNKALVLSGRARRLPNGSVVGYRVIQHGRVFRIPLIETASWLNLSSMKVKLKIDDAYTADKAQIALTAIANVKISNDPSIILNAVERFLEMEQEAIRSVAKLTLTGLLRSIIARQPFEQVVAKPEILAEEILHEPDLRKLGLQLDTLQIEQVEVRKPPSPTPSATKAGTSATTPEAIPEATTAAPPSAAPSAAPSAVPSTALSASPASEPGSPQQTAVSLPPADLNKLTDPTLDRAQRETLIKEWTGKKMSISLTVENVTYTTGMELPPDYRDGQTVIGKTPEGISLEALFPKNQTDQTKALKRGSSTELTTEILQWNELFSRLTVLVV